MILNNNRSLSIIINVFLGIIKRMYECSISRMDSIVLIPDSVYKSLVDNVYNTYIVFEYRGQSNTPAPQDFFIMTCNNCGDYFPDPEDIKGHRATEKIPSFARHDPYYDAMCKALNGETTILDTTGPNMPLNYKTSLKFFPIEPTIIGVIMKDSVELLDAKLQAQEATDIKNLFTANMSHEIRTPLSAIIGLTKLLETTDLGHTQKQYLRYMNQSCNALMTIVNDILDYAKLEGGRISLHHQDFIVRNLIIETCKILQDDIETKNIELRQHIHSDVPHCVIGDPARVTQIILNLLSNAIKFTPEGGTITVVVKLDGINSDDSFKLHFAVRDTGIGISKADQALLFKPYSQIDNSNTKKYKGAGLGLMISKKLVKLMGGEIWVDSDLGAGATFGFYISVKGCKNSPNLVLDELPRLVKNKKVLIVDDKAVNRLQLIKITKLWGMVPSVASSVAEAELLLEDSDFSLGLIDMVMPDQNGDALAKTIRDKRLGFPIIALSSLAESDYPQDAPFTSMMMKPINEIKLASMVLNVLSNEVQKPIFTHKTRRKVKILSAEDYQSNQIIICNYLKNMGYDDVDTATDGQDAVNKCMTERYDVIFMDIKMPIMDGLTASKLIWDYYKRFNHRVTIIALTAQAMDGDEDKFINEGFDGYISKPINIGALEGFMKRLE